MVESPMIARFSEPSRPRGTVDSRLMDGSHSGLSARRSTEGAGGIFGSIREAAGSVANSGRSYYGLDPERETERMVQEDWARLRDQGLPILDSIYGGVNDTSLVDSAKEDAANRMAVTQGRVDRSMGRRGTQMSPAQKKMLQDRMASSVTAQNASNVSSSRVNQQDLNQSRLNQTLSTMAALRSTSGGTLSNIAGQQIQREQANAQARAQSSSSFGSMLGTLAGGAIGMFGGPMGVAAGASIGGSIGGSF